MAKSLNDKVLAKTDELIELIKNTKDYKRYQDIKLQMSNNKELMIRISKIKELQKELVNKEYRKQDVTFLEKELSELNCKLNEMPLYKEYLYIQEDLDNLFQSIRYTIEDYINNKTN